MRRSLMVFIVGAFLLISTSYTAKAEKIVVVNLRKVMQESNAGKSAKQQIQTLIEAKKIVIKKKEDKVKAIINKLNNKKITKKEKDKLQKEYQSAMSDLQQYQAQASQEIRKKEIEETNKILKKAVDLVKNYAKKHNIDVVLETSQGSVVYWKDKLDITDIIIKMMNAKNKSTKK